MQINLVWFFQLLLFRNSICDFKDDPWYPRYHLSSLDGFMNDPNGMIFVGGTYHAYYQHTPRNVSPAGLKHWAHATSDDMVVWTHQKEALKPSIPEDIDGCFSGSAVTDKFNNIYVLYTGVSKVGDRTHQVQCLADSVTGLGYVFHKKGKVIESEVYFENFRDPKVWRDGDQYYVVVAAMNETGKQKLGQVMLYKSNDLKNWMSLGILAGPLNNTGFMWECPDMYTVGNKHILAFSIQEEKEDGSVGYRSGYLVGSWTEGKPFQIEKGFTEFDKGHDFYASQTFLANDSRRIQVAWMNMWDTPFPESTRGWVGCLTLPRELTLSPEGTLLINPIKEIESKRSVRYHLSLVLFEDQKTFLIENTQADGPIHEIELIWDIKNSNASEFGLKLTGIPEEEGFFLFVLKNESQLVLRRNYPQYGFPLNDKFLKIDPNSTLYTRIFFDYSTVEVFVNHGKTVMSSRIYPTGIQKNLALFTIGGDAVFKSFRDWYILAQ